MNRSIVFALAAAAALAACNGGAAGPHLTDIKVAKDKAMSSAVKSFAPGNTVYAQSAVAGNASPASIIWRLTAENVQGQQPNSDITQLDKSFDVDGNATSAYTLSPPAAGWPSGTYKVNAFLIVDGVQKDQKSAEFSIGP